MLRRASASPSIPAARRTPHCLAGPSTIQQRVRACGPIPQRTTQLFQLTGTPSDIRQAAASPSIFSLYYIKCFSNCIVHVFERCGSSYDVLHFWKLMQKYATICIYVFAKIFFHNCQFFANIFRTCQFCAKIFSHMRIYCFYFRLYSSHCPWYYPLGTVPFTQFSF